MSAQIHPEDPLLEEAIEAWRTAQVLYVSPAWNGHPSARHMVEVLKDRLDLAPKLVELLSHPNQLVAGYSLMALDLMDNPAVGSLPAQLLLRDERLTRMYGSFAEKIQLKAFARQVQKEWLRRRAISSS